MRGSVNKGIRIRNRKRAKNSKKAQSIKATQIGLCKFVCYKEQVIKRINGKYKRIGEQKGKGLQIENKIFLEDGSYKLLNRKSIKVTMEYEGIPEWANDILVKKYEIFKQSLKQDAFEDDENTNKKQEI